MRTLSLPIAVLAVGFVVCIVAPAVGAQTAFVLDDPILVADGRRVPVEGAPLRQDRFGALRLDVPSVGRYTISDAPFEGARRAGEFDGGLLVFASEGVSVRLRSRRPILGTARRPAYVRSAPSRRRSSSALVQLEGQRGEVVSRESPQPTARQTVRGPARRESRDVAQPLREEVARLRAEVARLAAEREQAARQRDGTRRTLQADLDRVTRERDALRAERDRALTERRALATQMEAARRDAEAARERRTLGERERTEARRLGAELDRLRREVIARDQTVAVLTAERDDRGEQVARLDAEVRRLSAALAGSQRERDAALRDRDAALAELTAAPRPANEEVLRLQARLSSVEAELERTRAERDRLAALSAVQSPELETREDEMDRLLVELERVQADLAAMAGQLQESEAARLALEAEVASLRGAGPASAAMEAERAALVQERDRLRSVVDELREQIERLQNEEAPTPAPPPMPPGESARLVLPGFDFGRLENPDEVREAVDATTLPAEAASGEVLVLFQTDDTGKVIRTAVPRPVGGGLDGVAEQIVRTMQFRPVQIDGQATGLRSQVVIRFDTES